MRLAKIITLLLTMLLLSACSRTVQWEEEVPLNTGETIWVQRSMPWIYKGGFGNPFDMAMRPTGNPPNLSLTPCKPYLDVVSHGV